MLAAGPAVQYSMTTLQTHDSLFSAVSNHIAGETITAGQAVYQDDSDSKVYLAKLLSLLPSRPRLWRVIQHQWSDPPDFGPG